MWWCSRAASRGHAAARLHDDGPGVPDEELAILTGEREPTRTRPRARIARWIAVGVGGEFGVWDRDGGSTIVRLYIPLASTTV